jgi:hypothetical protein
LHEHAADNHTAFYRHFESERGDTIEVTGERRFIEDFRQRLLDGQEDLPAAITRREL